MSSVLFDGMCSSLGLPGVRSDTRAVPSTPGTIFRNRMFDNHIILVFICFISSSKRYKFKIAHDIINGSQLMSWSPVDPDAKSHRLYPVVSNVEHPARNETQDISSDGSRSGAIIGFRNTSGFRSGPYDRNVPRSSPWVPIFSSHLDL